MREGPLAKRYARALFAAAAERNTLDAVAMELAAIADAFERNREATEVLCSPSVQRSAKLQIVDVLCKNGISDLTFEFLKILIRKGRFVLLTEIARHFELLRDEAQGRVRVKAVSAVPVSEEAKRDIAVMLQKTLRTEVRLLHEIDPQILGGLVVSVGGKIIDASLRGQLVRMKENLSN